MFVLHRSTDGGALVDALAHLLAEPPDDPFEPDVVAVPARGVERWLAQRMSHVLGGPDGDGVCANVVFPWPGTMLDEAVASVSPEHAESVRRWAPEQSTWALLELIDRLAPSEPWLRGLGRHLGLLDRTGVDEPDPGRRWTVADRLAHRYSAYGHARPDLIRAWAAGGDDGPEDLRWQARLWRALRERLAVPAPAEILADACAALRGDPDRCPLPGRLSVLGATRLSAARLDVLAALSGSREVHLWLHHPSPALWSAVAAGPSRRRRADPTVGPPGHPLLASLSRDVRELQELLAVRLPGHADVLHAAPPRPTTLLGRLQDDLARDRLPDPRPLFDPADRSVQVHACHGRTRQVEVLREVVLDLLDRDPTLEPRDVLVMCPDVETFAPIIAATFTLADAGPLAHPAADVPVRLADRALRQTNPLLSVLGQLLDLGSARLTATQVLDLAATAAVRRRFAFDDDDLEAIRDWVVAAGIRWGLDPGHRGTWGLEPVVRGTWRHGLDRVLLAVALDVDGDGDHSGVAGVDPVDDVDSSDIELAGRLAELMDRLGTAHAFVAGRHHVGAWAQGLEELVLSLAVAEPDAEWQELQLRGELGDLAESAQGVDVTLDLAEVRAVLAGVLAGRPTRASFRSGALTVCTLVPMRSVPHRVVVLLGLDDGVFPRRPIRDGDDVLARDPLIGEQDPRSEDRQLFLDAIGAARDHLVVTYLGADERTGATVPPAVPLGELLDALDRTASTHDGRPVRDAVTVRHPLQPFDERNFEAGGLRATGPFSYDPLGFRGALAASGERRPAPEFLPGPLPEPAPEVVELAALQNMFRNPAKEFLRQRLQVTTTREEEEPADAMAVELDPLQKWAVGERLLRDRVAGHPPEVCRARELRRADLPPGTLGDRLVTEVGRTVEMIVGAAGAELALPTGSLDVDVDLPSGRLVGTVGGVRDDLLLGVTYSALAAPHRLRAWIDLLALTASVPDRPWRAVAVGRTRGRGSHPVARCLLGPVDPDHARRTLDLLVSLYRAGLRSPLPSPPKTSSDYASRRRGGADAPLARQEAEKLWVAGGPSGSIPGEGDAAENVLVHGPVVALAALLRERPWPAETGAGWAADEFDRFGVLARAVWDPLLDAEDTVTS